MTRKPPSVYVLATWLAFATAHAQPAAPDMQQLRELMGQTGLSSSQLDLLRAEAARLQACVAKDAGRGFA